MSCDPARPHHVCVIGADSVVRGLLSGWLRAQQYEVAECERPPGGSYEACSADASDLIVIDADNALAWALGELDRLRSVGVWAPVIVVCPVRVADADVASVGARDLTYPVRRPMTISDFASAFARALEPARAITTIGRVGRELEAACAARGATRVARRKTEHGFPENGGR